ncbi:MAG: hypothetical protein JNK21_13785 [Rhodospirillaceae bacterium]|nr:hypothetical protein [Rhodospirillaceae bacterium]
MSMSFRKLMLITTAVSLLAQDVRAEEPKVETRVYLTENCIITREPETPPGAAPAFAFLPFLAKLVVPFLLNKVYDGVVKSLEEAAKAQEFTSAGKLRLDLYALAPSGALARRVDTACMTVVTGTFKSDAKPSGILPAVRDATNRLGLYKAVNTADGKTSYVLDENAHPSADAILAELNTANQIGATTINMFYEAKQEFSDDGTAFRVHSRYLLVNRLKSTSSAKTQRGLAFTLLINGPGVEPDSETLSRAALSFGNVTMTTNVNTSDFAKGRDGDVTGALKTVGISAASLQAWKEGKRRTNTSAPKTYMPVLLEARLTETKDGSKTAKFLAEVLSSGKEKILGAANEAIFPADTSAAVASAKKSWCAAYREKLKADIALAAANATGDAVKKALAVADQQYAVGALNDARAAAVAAGFAGDDSVSCSNESL